MPDAEIDLRPTKWFWGVALAAVLIFAAIGTFAFALPSPLWQRLAVLALNVIALLGIVDVAQRRLKLTHDGVFCVGNLRSKFVPRAQIDSVTWADGAGVSLKLVDGSWVHLPDLGRNSLALTNTIRAWLKRTSA